MNLSLIVKLVLWIIIIIAIRFIYLKVNKRRVGHRIIKAMVGNFVYKISGNEVWLDREWNERQSKMPDKNSWINLLVVFPIVLIFVMVVISYLVH